MTFEKAVRNAPHPVNGAYRSGIQTLENRHRDRVSCADSRRLTGSINLDSALAKQPGHADRPRWDYGLGYRPANGREQAIWVEIHSATTNEVSAVLRKLQWLRAWLSADAEHLKQLTDIADADFRFVWVASAGVRINRNSRQYRQLSQSGIRLRKSLRLP